MGRDVIKNRLVCPVAHYFTVLILILMSNMLLSFNHAVIRSFNFLLLCVNPFSFQEQRGECGSLKGGKNG